MEGIWSKRMKVAMVVAVLALSCTNVPAKAQDTYEELLQKVKTELKEIQNTLNKLLNLLESTPSPTTTTTTIKPPTDTTTIKPPTDTTTINPSTDTTTINPSTDTTTINPPTDTTTTTATPSSAGSKSHMSPQRKLLSSEDDICKPLNEDNPDPNDLCVRIKEVMATIEEVTKQINDGDVTEETLDTLTDQSEKLQEVVNEVEKNPELIDEYQINKEEMKKKTEDVKKEVDSALDTVTDKIDGPGSNVAVIVVGVIGGLIVVMLVAAGGYIGYRKHQQRQKRPKKMMNYDMLEEGGQNNPAFQMDRQQSGPSHQPQPGPPPSQPSPAPRPVSIPSRGVPVLPRVCSRPPSSYGEETGYISDSASRPSYMGSRASHTSHNTDRSSYPPSSSRPKGLYRIDP